MKKLFISLLMVAATVNAMAITYTGKAKLTLKSADNKSCALTIGESEDLTDGLNNGYYAELNTEGKQVLFYVTYQGVKYQQFASNAETMADMQLGIQTNAATTYTLTASNVVGTLNLKFAGVDYVINADGVVFSDVTLPASSTLPAAGDEANYRVNPSAEKFCFNYNILEINAHEGESLVVKKGTEEIANIPALPAKYKLDLSAQPADTRLVVTLNGKDYQIDANPTVTPANSTNP